MKKKTLDPLSNMAVTCGNGKGDTKIADIQSVLLCGLESMQWPFHQGKLKENGMSDYDREKYCT